MNPNHLDDLITRYFDGSASEAEVQELDTAIQHSRENRQIFADYLRQVQDLRLLAEEQEIENTAPYHETIKHKTSPRWTPALLSMAAMIAILLSALFLLRPWQGQKETPLSTKETFIQPYQLISSSGASAIRKLSNGTFLATTTDQDSSMTLELADQSRVHLLPQTKATFSLAGQRLINVTHGNLTFEITPQKPGSPLQVTTPSANLTVRGTRFSVESRSGLTQLEVAQGAVDIQHRKHQDLSEQTLVRAGHYAFTKRTEPTRPIALVQPPLNAHWECDLRDPSWSHRCQGEFLPDIGMKNIRSDSGKYYLNLPNAWSEGTFGHFQIDHQYQLCMRIKIERPEWFNIILNLRPAQLGETETLTAIYQDPKWWTECQPGEWHTIIIDYENPKRLSGRHADSFLEQSWAVFHLGVNSLNHDRGFTIERIWTEKKSSP